MTIEPSTETHPLAEAEKLAMARRIAEKQAGAVLECLFGSYSPTVQRVVTDGLKAAALAAIEECMAWRDIETFTEHGQNHPVILAVTDADRDDIVAEAWRHEDGEWWWAGTAPGDYYADPISQTNYGRPTHWQPLPLGPSAATTKGTPNDR